MPDRKPALLDRVPSGIAGLDIVLHGGFLKGGLYIIQGPPGVGKTMLGNQICFNHVAGGRRALYVTLLAEYHARMMQHLGVMTFFDVSKIPDQLSHLNGLDMLHESGLKGLLAMLRREIASRDASVLVLDGIVSARRVAASDKTFNEFVHNLQAIAIATDCTMFLLTSQRNGIIESEHTMVDGIIDLVDELSGWSAASSLQVVKFRGSDIMRGRHAFKITDDGIVVLPRIEALLARPPRPDTSRKARVSSGIGQLDTMLGGGMPEASTTMVVGPSGTGKTTLGLQFLSGSSAAEPGLLFGFCETPARIDAKITAVCQPLRALIDGGAVKVLWQPPIGELLDAHGERLLEAVHRYGVRRLFIDGLGAIQSAATAGGGGRIGMFLTALMNEMRMLGVTTVYTLEVPDVMGPVIRTSIGDLSILAENLIMLRFVELGSRLHRLISVLKMRDSAFDQSLYEYVTSGEGLKIEPNSDSAQAMLFRYSLQTAGMPPDGVQPRAGRGG